LDIRHVVHSHVDCHGGSGLGKELHG
jgi:hypothetical protein